MTESTVQSAVPDEVPIRPLRDAIKEIGIFSLVTTSLAFAVLAVWPGSDAFRRVAVTAPSAGERVLEHIGWGLGVDIPVLLGFYAIVIGGQFVASPATAARIRRRLGFVAEMMAAAITPTLLVIVAACIKDVSLAGALFVVLPAAALTYFLAAQLGGFVVFEDAIQLEAAIATRVWAAGALPRLRIRSRRNAVLVGTMNALVTGVAGVVVTRVLWGPLDALPLLVLLLAFIAVAAVLVFSGLALVQFTYSGRDRVDRFGTWFLPILVSMGVGAIAVVFIGGGIPSIGVSLLVVAGLVAMSSVWPRCLGGTWRGWTVKSVAVAFAARTVTKSYVSSVRKIATLEGRIASAAAASATSTPGPTPAPVPDLRARLLGVVAALRG